MEDILLHLLKSHLLLALFYVVYRFLLARQVWFQMNRIILLVMPILALLIPFFQFSVANNPFNPMEVIELTAVQLPPFELNASAGEAAPMSWLTISGWLYLFVSGFLMILMAYRLAKILSLPGIRTKGYSVTAIDGSSFSFFHKIFLNKSLDPETREMVIRHEQIHARQWHSADAVFYEIASAALWCNPMVWLMKKELRDTHEFIADREMKTYYPQRDYLNALLNATFSTRSIQFLPMFNHSQTLIKRVTMMNIKKIKIQRLRYLVALPLVAVIAFTFACTDKDEQLSPAEQASELLEVKEEPMTIVDQMPEFPGGQEALFSYLSESITYPEAAKTDSISGVVYISFVIEKDGAVDEVQVRRGIGGGCDEEARRVVSEMPAWIPGSNRGEKVRVLYNLPIRFQLKE